MNPVQNLVVFLTWMIKAIVSGESVGTIAWQAVSRIPGLIASLMALRDLPSSEQVDHLLAAADNHLGIEHDALDILATLPPAQEEILTDAALNVTEILIKNALQLPGYHTDAPPEVKPNG